MAFEKETVFTDKDNDWQIVDRGGVFSIRNSIQNGDEIEAGSVKGVKALADLILAATEANLTDYDLPELMKTTLETVLMYITNVNSIDIEDVASSVISTLRLAGCDGKEMDDAAACMVDGAASIPGSSAATEPTDGN